MEQGEPCLGTKFDNNDELATLFQLPPSFIGDETFQLVPQVASTGLWDIMLPIKSKEVLYTMKPDFEAITAFTKKQDVAGIHAFTLNTEEAIAESRNFCPRYDINEEAATGTSTGALTYYLAQNGVSLKQDEFQPFLQGHSMGRPSTTMPKMIVDNPSKILVGGSAVILSKGKIY